MPLEARDSSVPGVSKGLGWYYVDVNRRSVFQPSQKTLDDKNQAIAYTLQQYYDKQNDPNVFHVMFNDEVCAVVA
uniref:Piwi domain-containing protein n=1 Tax=Heterorhabditis bacteriophora TaxID=37862 RepID=A0A1I7WXM2_HETBA